MDNKVVRRENDEYLVVKTKDLDKYFLKYNFIWNKKEDSSEKILFMKIINRIREMRESEGKKDNRYIVCNEDEFYAEAIRRIILWGEEMKKRDCGVCPFCGKLPFEMK